MGVDISLAQWFGFLSKISIFIILYLYLTVFCLLPILSNVGTLQYMNRENNSAIRITRSQSSPYKKS